MFLKGRPVAEGAAKTFQRQEQSIYKPAGLLIKKEASKALSPVPNQKATAVLTDAFWSSQKILVTISKPVLHLILFTGFLVMKAEVVLEWVPSTPPQFTLQRGPYGNVLDPSPRHTAEGRPASTGVKTAFQTLGTTAWVLHLSTPPAFSLVNRETVVLSYECCAGQVPKINTKFLKPQYMAST